MNYLISNASGYFIRKDPTTGKYVPIRSADKAATWDDEDKAKNILRNCLNKKMQQEYKVAKVAEQESPGADNSSCAKAFHVSKITRAEFRLDVRIENDYFDSYYTEPIRFAI